MDDLGETFDWQAAIAAENRQKAIDRNARLTREESERKAKADAESARSRDEFNKRLVRREYEHAGVEPPIVGADGVPTVSLSFLLGIGWTIQEFEGKPTLVKPDKLPTKIRSGIG